MKFKILVFFLFFAIAADLYAREFNSAPIVQADSTKSKYSLSGRIALETVAGTGVSLLTLIVLLPDTDIFSAYLLSEVFGISTALVLGEYVFDDNGNISKAIGGGIIGMVSSILFVALTNDNDSKNIAKGVAFLGFPTLGASIGYNLDEINKNRNPIIQYSKSNGGFNLSIPQISLIFDNSLGWTGMIRSVNLVRISF